MIETGLASVTFRRLTIAEVATIAVEARLQAIEWGGDVHVPPGDVRAAEEALTQTSKRGLRVASYGSYYRAADSPPDTFKDVLASAAALGAPRMRVWAGKHGSGLTSATERSEVVDDLRRITEQASAAGILLATEFHSETLADTIGSTLELLDAVPGLWTYWQPPIGVSAPSSRAAVVALSSRLAGVHCFSLRADRSIQRLAEGAEIWTPVLAELSAKDRKIDVMLEFVIDDDPAALYQDAECLRSWLTDIKV